MRILRRAACTRCLAQTPLLRTGRPSRRYLLGCADAARRGALGELMDVTRAKCAAIAVARGGDAADTAAGEGGTKPGRRRPRVGAAVAEATKTRAAKAKTGACLAVTTRPNATMAAAAATATAKVRTPARGGVGGTRSQSSYYASEETRMAAPSG